MPVVFGYSGDPVEAGVVASLARPGRNFTGATFLSLRASQSAAKALGLSLQYCQAQNAARLEEALAALLKAGSEAVDVFPDALMMRYRERNAEVATKNRIPAISGWAQFADGGNLMSYGPSSRDMYRRLATYVDKIFRGAKPADLPVELPMTFELVVNMKTARALGLTIPPTIMVRATRVIE